MELGLEELLEFGELVFGYFAGFVLRAFWLLLLKAVHSCTSGSARISIWSHFKRITGLRRLVLDGLAYEEASVAAIVPRHTVLRWLLLSGKLFAVW